MKRNLLKIAAAGAVVTGLMLTTAGCGSGSSGSGGSQAAGAGSGGSGDDGVRTVIVGSGCGYEPYTYLDENGDPAGYDIEVVKAVDELLPEYEFEIEVMEFTNILIGVDEGQIDMGANQIGYNEERGKKYSYSDPYSVYSLYIVVAAGRDDIQSLDDLGGKKCFASTGGDDAYLLEQYNSEHPDNQIEIVYNDFSYETTSVSLAGGKADAILLQKSDADYINSEFGESVQAVGEPVSEEYSYFIFQKEDTGLCEAVTGALKQLDEDGTLLEIAMDTVGFDVTPGA